MCVNSRTVSQILYSAFYTDPLYMIHTRLIGPPKGFRGWVVPGYAVKSFVLFKKGFPVQDAVTLGRARNYWLTCNYFSELYCWGMGKK